MYQAQADCRTSAKGTMSVLYHCAVCLNKADLVETWSKVEVHGVV